MNYWGNDIVVIDDQQDQTNERLDRWIAKVCTNSEQAWLAESKQRNRDRWLLWSCKESTYKVLMKTGVPTFLNAKRIEIVLGQSDSLGEQHFKANFEGKEFWGKSTWKKDWIHSVCCNHPLEGQRFRAGVISSGATTTSEDIREEVIAILTKEYDFKVKGIVQSASNVPMVVCDDSGGEVDLSFSHEGGYSAYVFRLSYTAFML